MPKTIHRSPLIVLSCFTLCFLFFLQRSWNTFRWTCELWIVLCAGITLCKHKTAKKKKKKEGCRISNFLEKMSLLLSVWGRKQILGKLGFFNHLWVEERAEIPIHFPYVSSFSVLVCSITSISLSHPVHPSTALCSPLPRTEFELSSLPQQSLFTRWYFCPPKMCRF